MKKFPVVLDIETKYTFRQYVDPKNLEVTVAGLYDYRDQRSKVFVEKELPKLFSLLETSSYIIGFNVRSFDLPVLQRYYPGRLQHFPIFEMFFLLNLL